MLHPINYLEVKSFRIVLGNCYDVIKYLKLVDVYYLTDKQTSRVREYNLLQMNMFGLILDFRINMSNSARHVYAF